MATNFVMYSWHVDHIISHFFTELKIYHHSLFITYITSVVRLSDRCTEGHRFNSCRWLRFFPCLVLVTCRSHYFSPILPFYGVLKQNWGLVALLTKLFTSLFQVVLILFYNSRWFASFTLRISLRLRVSFLNWQWQKFSLLLWSFLLF